MENVELLKDRIKKALEGNTVTNILFTELCEEYEKEIKKLKRSVQSNVKKS